MICGGTHLTLWDACELNSNLLYQIFRANIDGLLCIFIVDSWLLTHDMKLIIALVILLVRWVLFMILSHLHVIAFLYFWVSLAHIHSMLFTNGLINCHHHLIIAWGQKARPWWLISPHISSPLHRNIHLLSSYHTGYLLQIVLWLCYDTDGFLSIVWRQKVQNVSAIGFGPVSISIFILNL